MHKKSVWYQAEQLVAQRYQRQWWTVVKNNFTIRGWEIDIVCQNNQYIAFIEVKCVNSRDDIIDYIWYYKRAALKRTISRYLYMYPSSLQPRIDIVYVKHGDIYYHVVSCVDF